jgi:hypothetical protein
MDIVTAFQPHFQGGLLMLETKCVEVKGDHVENHKSFIARPRTFHLTLILG